MTTQVQAQTFPWQLVDPVDAIVFDCDGTMSDIEGICALAEQNNVGPAVKALTEHAMAESGITTELYAERLALVKPSRQQLIDLAQTYFDHRTHDLVAVIKTMQSLDKAVYVISAGMNPSVKLFAELCHIPQSHVYAVDLMFDNENQFQDFDHCSPMTKTSGKIDILRAIMQHHPRLAFVGDGMNDVHAKDCAARFVGYGGAFYREKIASHCDFYITLPSMSPILPLCLTPAEVRLLSAEQQGIYAAGLDAINERKVLIR